MIYKNIFLNVILLPFTLVCCDSSSDVRIKEELQTVLKQKLDATSEFSKILCEKELLLQQTLSDMDVEFWKEYYKFGWGERQKFLDEYNRIRKVYADAFDAGNIENLHIATPYFVQLRAIMIFFKKAIIELSIINSLNENLDREMSEISEIKHQLNS
jgi:hypothetical protein